MLLGLAAAIAVGWFTSGQVSTKFGVLAVLLVAPCVAMLLGAINGALIVAGRLQPFIATLAMMVGALGIGRLTAGQDNAVVAVYTGTNATEDFELLRSMVWGVLPMPSVFFLAAIILFGVILRFTAFGRYVYAIGGNVEAAKLSGIKVAQVQFTAYLISLAVGRDRRRPLRRSVPAGQTRCRLRSRARRDRRGGHRRNEPHGWARRVGRHVRRRSHLWPAFRHSPTAEHRLQRSARHEGPDHRLHGARAGTEISVSSWRDGGAKLRRLSHDHARIGRSGSAA